MTSTDPQATGSTTATGAPAPSDRNSLTIGSNGPILLHDHHFIDQMAHFNREKVPERQPHAKGGGAFGTLEVTEDVSQYTKASLFQKGAKTESLVRFSTVALEAGSTDTVRDPRGFAMKFYTDEGNYDLVGNNTPIFFIRDAIKFPHFIRSQKRLAGSHLRSADMQWDFWTLNPETAHQVTWLMGDRGIPRSWRNQDGFGSHTYQWVNANGEKFWVKYHFKTQQGIETLTNDEAAQLRAEDPDYHIRDLYENIEKGNFPTWSVEVQVMPYEDAASYRFNPFDLTKVWPHADYPRIKVGTWTLNRNPDNYFAQIEQAAFSPSNRVPGIGFSPDKMLLGRVFAYSDAQRNRIGTNFHQLPVNRPKVPVDTYMFDGAMAYDHSGSQPTYAPNSKGRAYSDGPGDSEEAWAVDGELLRAAYSLHSEDSDFVQPNTLYTKVFDDGARDRLHHTVAGALGTVTDAVYKRAIEYWTNVAPDAGSAIDALVKGTK
ncbi:catalase [Antricoccus suffuscus]|uniref:Catalase n=1 Tax=Antricoccus suffuscus TaxID=1629062 RepID=A0A2T0Z5F0_9ACTN|nr:catalase [Antricoccus suffuscus]PRZ31384.1 catalase [Antricoccus suffuscus]